MAFNPLQSFLSGQQAGQMQQSNRLAGSVANEMQNPNFNASNSADFRQLQAIDPERASKSMEQFQSLSNDRKKAYFDDMVIGRSLLQANDMTGFGNFLDDRLTNLNRLGSEDPSGTEMIRNKFNEGDVTGIMQIFDSGIQAGQQLGFLGGTQASNQGKPTADMQNFEKLEQLKLNGTPEEVNSFSRMLGLSKAPEMSTAIEKQVVKAQDDYFKYSEQARLMDVLSKDISNIEIGGGLKSTLSEKFKNILGSTEEVTSLRLRFNAIRTSQATSNLPPGAASDKDIEMALSGFPKENANAETIISFLQGQKKLSKVNEKFAEFKADFFAVNNSPSGLIPAWKKYAKDNILFDTSGDVNEGAITPDYESDIFSKYGVPL